MAKYQDILRCNILISCPSDIEEVQVVKDAINSFNKGFGRKNNIVLDDYYWKDDIYPKSNQYPQESINKILVTKSDMAIALIWTKIGSKTKKYESGTIEEIEQLIKDGKQVFLYFCEKNIKPSLIDSIQLDKVNKFKNDYRDNNLYFTYENENELSNLIIKHLEIFFEQEIQGFAKSLNETENNLDSCDLKDSLEGNLRNDLKEKSIYHENQSLDEYITMFEKIYEPIQNVEREFNQILARLLEAIAECSQYVNKANQKGLADNLPKVFSWYCSLVYKSGIGVNLSKALWKKFPGVCPYCLSSSCKCTQGKKNLVVNASELERLAIENMRNKPVSLYDWQTMFSKIYPRNAEGYDQKIIFAHLIEELGEASEAFRIRYYVPTALESELADIFTWIIGMANFVNSHAIEGSVKEYSNYNFAEQVFQMYKGVCPNCKSIPCICVTNTSRQRISELNVVYSEQIESAIKTMNINMDADVLDNLKSTDFQNLILEIRNNINSANDKDDINDDKFIKMTIKSFLEDDNYTISLKGIEKKIDQSKLILIIENILKKAYI